VASSPARLAVSGLTVRRGNRSVLDGLAFEVAAGEIFGLLGPNGAGKTTAFQVLAGLLPGTGTFTLDGMPIRPGDRTLRARMGVVFQEPALDPRFTARENLALSARMYGLGRGAARERIAAELAATGLADRADEPVGTFSGGMRRRIELARALVHDPAILVLDEPTTGLDEGAFRDVWARLHALRAARGLTILLTTHRPEEAERCDRLGILDGGRLVACDTPEGLRRRVHGDLVVVEVTGDPQAAAALLGGRVLEGRVVLERDRGHEEIPRIVEALPPGTVRAITLRTAGLGEAFLELTGHELEKA